MDILIWGTGGFAREVLQIALDCGEAGDPRQVVGFLDGDEGRHGQLVHGLPVLGGADWLRGRDDVSVVIGVGNPVVRRKIAFELAEATDAKFATLQHPRAWVGRNVAIGDGSILCAGVQVTCDISLGRHVILNLNTTVGHDAVIGDFVTVAPGVSISGAVRCGEGTDLGTGSSLIQSVEIGAWSVVGAGSVVVKPIPANVTAVGVPAKVIKQRESGWHLG
ncbi:MAG: acetyltransferase [Sandaracinaceae bacterium]|nr:MAG: acetyltransferase [Sandaracinaceae bacterium]